MVVSEYDAFGPWIYEISEEHPAPELFKPYIPEEPCLMCFKIPRDIERRRATPDMDLYDYVVGAYEEYICILKRIEHTVEKSIVRYRDVEGICLFRKFLRGTCTLCLKNGEAVLPFNVVSIATMTAFVGLVRQRYMTESERPVPGCQPLDSSIPEMLFVNLTRELKESGEKFQTVAYQPEMPVLFKKETFSERIAHIRRPQRIPAALHLISDRELLIIQRELAAKKTRENEYGYTFTYLPLSKIRDIQFEKDKGCGQILKCLIRMEHTQLELDLDESNQKAGDFYRTLSGSLR